jgi:hypothetical protein
MISEKTPKDDFSEIFSDHTNTGIYAEFHQVLALLLFPPNGNQDASRSYKENRENVVLSLNVELYNNAQKENINPEDLRALRYFLKIPEDVFFREHYGEGYPLWLIKDDFKKRIEENHYRCVERLITTFLRLSETYKIVIGEPRASLKEALETILGKTPLKAKSGNASNENYLGGEKMYAEHFATYKPVCHYIAALGELDKERGGWNRSPVALSFSQIKSFFRLAHWFRTKLLELKTPNVKNNILFTEESLLNCPSWVESEEINLSFEAYRDKLEELEKSIQIIDPREAFRERMEKRNI